MYGRALKVSKYVAGDLELIFNNSHLKAKEEIEEYSTFGRCSDNPGPEVIGFSNNI